MFHKMKRKTDKFISPSSQQSHAGRLRLEVDVEPVDFEMSLDIEEQVACHQPRRLRVVSFDMEDC